MSHLPLFIFIGGGLGALGRYSMTIFVAEWLGTTFPYGTWLVNGLGSFLIGLLGFFLTHISPSPTGAAFLITGLLGGFTTFSSFMNETLQLFLSGNFLSAICYIALQLFCGLLAVSVGYLFASRLFA